MRAIQEGGGLHLVNASANHGNSDSLNIFIVYSLLCSLAFTQLRA